MSSFYVIIASSFRVAFKQLLRHKMRSFLTLLGILIGISSVVTIVSLGEGLRSYFNQQMSSQANADLLYVMPDTPMRKGRWDTQTRAFKNRDLEAMKRSQYVESVIGGTLKYGQVIKHGWRSENSTVMAMPASYFPLENIEVEYGRAYTLNEERASAAVCVIGSDLPELLYDMKDRPEMVLGTDIQLNGVRLTVVGVLKSKSALGGGGDYNKSILLPLTTGQRRVYGEDDVFWIVAKVTDSTKLAEAEEEVATLLRQSRKIRRGADDDFKITTPDDWAKFANSFVNGLITVFGVVAAIALAVGGIGVMNIMLVSVKERTREIGLRKAVGASSSNITWQFLIEAISLCILGGLLGIIAGYSVGGLAAIVLESMFDVSWAPAVPFVWVVIVLITCIAIGLAFGVYPAFRAGRLDPIVALRYE